MLRALQAIIVVLGVSAIVIAASIFVFGAQQTAWTCERIFAVATGWRGSLSEPWSASSDSELRFYAAYWFAYGVVMLRVVRDLSAHGRWVPWLAAVFFLGGLGRVVSWLSLGPPHPFFQLLMVSELTLPPLIILLWIGARRSGAAA